MFQLFISKFPHPLERGMLAEPPCPNVHLHRILGEPGRKRNASSSLLEHHVSQETTRFRSWALIGRGNHHRL